MFREYVRLLICLAGLLLGVQIPALMGQYQQQVAAHLSEANRALAGFEQTAQRHFGGDLELLVYHYRHSEDAVFQDDANTLEQMIARRQRLQTEHEAMQGPFYERFFHLVFAPMPQLRTDAFAAYRYQVPLTPSAILWGLSGALLLALFVDLLWSLLLGIVRAIMPRQEYIY